MLRIRYIDIISQKNRNIYSLKFTYLIYLIEIEKIKITMNEKIK